MNGNSDSTFHLNALPIVTRDNQAAAVYSSEGKSSGGREAEPKDALLEAPEDVLSTLRSDGSRRWLRPRLEKGDLWKRRRAVAYALIAFFVALPHVRINGKPPILLNIVEREFTFFGHVFLPTDTLLLALLMLGVIVVIVAATAIAGRLWCGWACPQTVYMEFLFRPIDRLFEGTVGKGGKPKREQTLGLVLARWGIYLVLSAILAHTFLAYFVGTDQLASWLTGSPLDHPIAFLVMATTTGLMLFDFLFFREQLCLIACPYGRFQSVMLDDDSLIVAYDPLRGEPRRKGRRDAGETAGDCVDCHRCVVVCPTGIDIRDGLQMECVNCTQCIDACNEVMDRVGTPRGLIRYTSQHALAGVPQRILRLRTILYPLILVLIATAFIAVLSTKYAFDARLIRNTGNPFYRTESGDIANRFRLRITNRTEEDRSYQILNVQPEGFKAALDANQKFELAPGQSELFQMKVSTDSRNIDRGKAEFTIHLGDDAGNQRSVTSTLLGPR